MTFPGFEKLFLNSMTFSGFEKKNYFKIPGFSMTVRTEQPCLYIFVEPCGSSEGIKKRLI